MNNADYEDWLEGFASVALTKEELEQINYGQRQLSDDDLRNLVREVTFLRYMVSELVKRCEELGDAGEKSMLLKYARFVLASRGKRGEK